MHIVRGERESQAVKEGLEVFIRYDTKHILMHKILRPEKEQNNYQKSAKRRKKRCYPSTQ